MQSENLTRRCHWSWLAIALASCLAVVGCSESEDSSCGSDEDCSAGEECLEGVCQVSDEDRCNRNTDCPPALVCRDFECVEREDTGPVTDTGDEDPSEDTGAETGGDTGDDATEDSGTDTSDETGPEVVDVEPERGAQGVERTTDITITFSEPLREASVHEGSVSLADPDGRQVELFGGDAAGSVEQPAPDTLVITTDDPLHPASPYRVVLTENLHDEQRNQLVDAPVEIAFATDWSQPAHHVDAAREWAPWIYQGIAETSGAEPHADLPTTVDFDDDLDASNNEENARASGGVAPEAHLYYDVVESTSHLFLTYVAYYPSFQADPNEDGEHHEHHFAAVRLLIDKETDSLVLADGLSLEEQSGGAEWAAFTEQGSGVEQVGQNSNLIEVDSSNWQLEDQTHYPAYVMAGNHQTCHWYSEGDAGGISNTCLHSSAEFVAGQGAVLKPGDDAQSWDDRDTEQSPATMTYELVPLVEDFWALRNQTGESRLFGERFLYQPNSAQTDPLAGFPGSDDNHRLPKALNSDDADSLGPTPYYWQSFNNSDGDEGAGQWTLDPAYVTADRFSFQDGSTDVATDYCFNLYFSIDERGSESCPSTGGGDADGGTDTGMSMDTGELDAGN